MFYTPLGHITQNTSVKNFLSITPELTEKECKNWRHIWSIIKPEVEVIRNMTDRAKNNQAGINDLPNLRYHDHSLSSYMILKVRINGESMQEVTTYLANY